MRINLHAGIYSTAGAAIIAGGGLMAQSATQPVSYDFGVAGVIFGIALLLWGIKINGEHWWKRERIKVTWPYALMAVSVIAFIVGSAFAYAQRGTPVGGVSKPAFSSSAAVSHVSTKPIVVPAGSLSRKAIEAQSLEAARAQIIRVPSPPRSIVSLENNEISRELSPVKISNAKDGRLIIQFPKFDAFGADENKKFVYLNIKNTGDAPAYGGIPFVNISFNKHDKNNNISYSDDDLNSQINQARKSKPQQNVSVEVGESLSTPTIEIRNEDWAAVVSGDKIATLWMCYAYVTPFTPAGKINVATYVAVYTAASNGTLTMGLLDQNTKLFERLP